MAKLPAYMKVIDGYQDENGVMQVKLQIRKWHPGCWWFVVRRIAHHLMRRDDA